MFRDRQDAGAQLAARLVHLGQESPVVLGLARGGVPVAREVAAALAAPLDVLVVRKLGAPGRDELALGAIGEGVRILNERVVNALRISERELREIEVRERRELTRRTRLYRAGRPGRDVDGLTTIVVDDGIATGASAIAACRVVRQQGAKRIVLAAPLAPLDWRPPNSAHIDEFVTVHRVANLRAIGRWYEDFTQVSDEAVMRLLA